MSRMVQMDSMLIIVTRISIHHQSMVFFENDTGVTKRLTFRLLLNLARCDLMT